MALTPAQRHRARVLAEKAQAASPFGIELQGNDYQLMLAKLATDKRTLKTIESIQLKRQTKARLLPDYLPWIEGAIAKGQGAQDVVLTTLMVWAIDAGAYGLALRISGYVLQHKLPLPDQYQRSTATLLLDEFSDAYLRGQWVAIKPVSDAQGNPVFVADDTHPVEHLTAVGGLTAEHDAPDQARAKLLKATAYGLLGKVQTAETPDLDALPTDTLGGALAMLIQALALDALSGVKKDIERIERKLRATADGKATPPPAVMPSAQPAAKQPATPKRARPAKKQATARSPR